MKSYTRDEFIEYVRKLEFDDLGDCAYFVSEYYEHYKSVPEANKVEKQEAWEKYVVLITKFGITFTAFTLMVMDMKKLMDKKDIGNDLVHNYDDSNG
jgi:hypothetical protein